MDNALPEGFTAVDSGQPTQLTLVENSLPEGFTAVNPNEINSPSIRSGLELEQEMTSDQTKRLSDLTSRREENHRRSRDRHLERFGVEKPPLTKNREQILLGKGVEVGGTSLTGARTQASFTSNPIPTITKGLLAEFPEATEQNLNVRFIQFVPKADLEKQIDTAISIGNARSEEEISGKLENNPNLTESDKGKIIARNMNAVLTRLPGLELVYNDPNNDGRVTAVNPSGAEIGDFSELLGPSIPTTLEIGGGTVGTIAGASGGGLPGAVVFGGLGGAAGRGAGEAMRLGIGIMMGVEPSEADFLDPVTDEAIAGGINNALGAGISSLIAGRIASAVANGKFGISAARFGNFLDPQTFSRNAKAIEEFNKLAKSKGLKPLARPTFGQLNENKFLMGEEEGFKNANGVITQQKAENGRLLDDVSSSFDKGGFIKKDADIVIGRIAGDIERRIRAREATLGRQLELSEAREEAIQVDNILRGDIATDNVLAAESLRDISKKASDKILKERFGKRFTEIEEQTSGLSIEPKSTIAEAKKIIAERDEQSFKARVGEEDSLLNRAEGAGVEQGSFKALIVDVNGDTILNPEIPKSLVTFKGLDKTSSELKAVKRLKDVGAGQSASSRTIARLIGASEDDLIALLDKHGLKEVKDNLFTLRSEYGEAKRLNEKSIGKMLNKDQDGNFKVDDVDVFEKVILNPSAALGIKSILVESGQEAEIGLIREGIRDVYAKKFLPEGAAPNQLKPQALNWFNQNELALKQYFSPAELKAFKNPAQMAIKEQKNREKMRKAQEFMRKEFGADLANTKETPQEFMDIIFNKATPSNMAKLKGSLIPERWTEFKDMFRGEMLARMRRSPSEGGLDKDRLFSAIAKSKTPTTRELVNRNTIEQVLGKKEVENLSTFAEAIRILEKAAPNIERETGASKLAKQAVRFFVKPLSVMSRRVKSVMTLGKNNVENSMEQALSDPIRLEKMIKSVREFREDPLSQTALIGFVDAIGNDFIDKNLELEKQLKEE